MSNKQTTTDQTQPTGQPPPAFRFGFTRDWPGYFAAVQGKPPRETTLFALDRFAAEGIPDSTPTHPSRRHPDEPEAQARDSAPIAPTPPTAVDLGCGEGRDAAELLARGFRVVGIDGHEAAFESLAKRDRVLEHPNFEPRLTPFEECSIPRCTLLNASFALPFCHPDSFDALWRIIRFAIEPGGRFAGQLFGDRDTWAALPDRTHHTRTQAEKLLLGMDVEMFKEDEKDAADSEGNDKHWHVYHIVAKNPTE